MDWQPFSVQWRSLCGRFVANPENLPPDSEPLARLRAESAMFKVYTVQTELGGRKFNGSYSFQDGKVCVMSAYGSQSGKASNADHKEVATHLMEQIVKARG